MDSQTLGSAEVSVSDPSLSRRVAEADAVGDFVAKFRELVAQVGFDKKPGLLGVAILEIGMTTDGLIPISAQMSMHIRRLKDAAARGQPRTCSCVVCLRMEANLQPESQHGRQGPT
jgi:hypothetical protein